MQRDGKWGVQSVHSHFVCCFSTSSASFLPDLGDCTNAPHIFFPSFSACVHYFFSPFLNTCSPRCHHLVCLAQLCSAVGLLEPTGSGCLAEENPGLFSQMPPPQPHSYWHLATYTQLRYWAEEIKHLFILSDNYLECHSITFIEYRTMHVHVIRPQSIVLKGT